jgi:hypothetical protein
MDEWEDKQTGQKRTKLKVEVQSFHLLPQGRKDDGAAPARAARRPAPAEPGGPVDGDDVPF